MRKSSTKVGSAAIGLVILAAVIAYYAIQARSFLSSPAYPFAIERAKEFATDSLHCKAFSEARPAKTHWRSRWRSGFRAENTEYITEFDLLFLCDEQPMRVRIAVSDTMGRYAIKRIEPRRWWFGFPL